MQLLWCPSVLFPSLSIGFHLEEQRISFPCFRMWWRFPHLEQWETWAEVDLLFFSLSLAKQSLQCVYRLKLGVFAMVICHTVIPALGRSGEHSADFWSASYEWSTGLLEERQCMMLCPMLVVPGSHYSCSCCPEVLQNTWSLDFNSFWLRDFLILMLMFWYLCWSFCF